MLLPYFEIEYGWNAIAGSVICNPDQEHEDGEFLFFINELSKHSRWAGMSQQFSLLMKWLSNMTNLDP